MMLKTISQKGSALITYLTFGLISAGVTGYYLAQGKVVDQNSERIALLSQQIEQVQAAQLSCFNDLRRWCTPGELPAYVPGDLNTLDGTISFNQVGDNLRFSVATSSEREAEILSNMLVSGASTANIASTTILPPTDASVFSERLQRYTNNQDAARTSMDVTLDMNNNQIINIGNLFSENITADEVVADELVTGRTIVNSELDIGGNRIVSNSGDIDIFSDRVIASNDMNVVGNVTLQNSDAQNIDQLSANSGVFDTLLTRDLVSDNGVIGTLDAQSITALNTVANSATFYDLNTDTLVFDSATGQQLNVDLLNVNNTLTGINLTSVDGSIENVETNTITANTGVIDNLTSTVIDTTTLQANGLTASSANINNIDANSVSFNTLTASNFVSDIATMNELTVNDSMDVSNRTTVNNSIVAREFIGLNRVNIGDVYITNAEMINADVTEIDIDAGNATLTNFRVSEIDVDEVNANSASIADVWVDNNLNADRIVANLATTRFLDVQNSTIGTATIASLQADNATTQNLFANNIEATNGNFGSLTADSLTVDYADIGEFNINNTLTVNKITGDAFIADEFTGDSFYAAGDFFSSDSSVNANANNLNDLFDALDNCINVTGYCLEKEPDFLISCINCTQSRPQVYFTSRIDVNVQECLQGCTLSFDLDGMDNVSGCGTVTLPAGFSGVRSCRVGASVPTETTVVFNPIVTMNNSRRPQFESTASTTIRYTNTLPRNPQFSLSCTDCFQTSGGNTFDSRIRVSINQCVEGCTLSFNLGGLTPISGCGVRNFSAGYTGTVSCRVRRFVPSGSTFNGSVSATLANAVYGDSSSLSTSIRYESIDNPPDYDLTCTGCNQAALGGSYTAELEVDVNDCAQGCSVSWNTSGFDSTSGCFNRNLGAGYSSSFTCRVTKFVSEQNSFSRTVSVTLTNSLTSQSVTKTQNVRFENTGTIVDPSDIEDAITGYTFQYRNSRFTATSQQNDPVITRTRSDFNLFTLEGSFWDASLHIGGRSRISFTNISFGSGTVCDAGACEVDFESVSETSPSGSFNGSVGAQIYSCSERGRTGTEIYYAAFEGDSTNNPSSICEANVTIRITHTDSGEFFMQTIPLRPLVSF